MLGLCLLASGLADRAKIEVQLALSRQPNSAFAHYALSLVHRASTRVVQTAFFARRGNIIQASACLRSALKAVELAPEDERYLVHLAEAHQMLRQWQKSVDAAERALALSPTNLRAAIARAESLVRLGRSQEASATLSRALAMNPEASAAHAGMGWALLRAGDHVGATNFFNEALRIRAGLGWAQEGALECAKHRYCIYRWIFRCKVWFSAQPSLVRGLLAIAPLALVFVVLVPLLNWIAPPVPRGSKDQAAILKNQLTGFVFLFVTCTMGLAIIFHEQIFLWLVRRHTAAQTSTIEKKKELAKAQVGLVVTSVCIAVVGIVIGAFSKRLLAASTGLIPGLLSLWLAVRHLPANRRALWIVYALCLLIAGPFVGVAVRTTVEKLNFGAVAILLFIPMIPICIAIDQEKKRALERKHDSALAAINSQKPKQ